MFVCKLNPTVLDCLAYKDVFSLDGIRTHIIDTLQRQSISLMSSYLNVTSTMLSIIDTFCQLLVKLSNIYIFEMLQCN